MTFSFFPFCGVSVLSSFDPQEEEEEAAAKVSAKNNNWTGNRRENKKGFSFFFFSKLLEKSSNKNGTPNLFFNGHHLISPGHLLKEENLFPYFFFNFQLIFTFNLPSFTLKFIHLFKF